MYFQRLNATFGKLHQRTLSLQKGLNIIEAPNESGKSTFAAFLKDMFYGVPSGRGKAAVLTDRARFAPWSGEAMEGSMDLCETIYGDMTLARSTKRASAPFGNLIATYSGSGDRIDAISGENCGEQLLGIPRGVFERSAFIRQSGLAIEADSDLEKRITSLITSGEEDTSYTDAETALRKALNAHRHNNTGAIPVLERELAALQSERAELSSLITEKQNLTQKAEQFLAREEEINTLLQRHKTADAQEQYELLQAVRCDLKSAEAKYEALQENIRSLPSEDTCAQAQAHLDALVTMMRQCETAQNDTQSAKERLDLFDRETAEAKKFDWGHCYAVLVPLTYIIIGSVWMIIFGFSRLHAMIPLGIALLLSFPLSYVIGRRNYNAKRAKERTALDAKWQTEQSALAAQESACRTQEQTILNLLRVSTLDEARSAIQHTTQQHRAMRDAQSEAKEATVRYDVLSRQIGDLSAPAEKVTRPSESVSALQEEQNALIQKAAQLQSEIDRAEGRLHAIGDLAELTAQIEEKQEKLARLQEEYDAIALAMDTLGSANTDLQSRFSPALGARAAEIFSALTDGKYDRVLLDRKFGACAGEEGAPTTHDVSSLSQGAYDQLYFAVRLAICELVLPEERNIPIVLDDALTNFDDERMKKALDLLADESEHRQILLFTCQHREAAYMKGKPNISIIKF